MFVLREREREKKGGRERERKVKEEKLSKRRLLTACKPIITTLS